MSRRPEPARARLRRIIVPGTTGGLFTVYPGTLGFLVILGLFVHAYFTGRQLPAGIGDVLLASVGLLGLHTARGTSADRANAANGLGPVPVEDPPSTASTLPELRPTGP